MTYRQRLAAWTRRLAAARHRVTVILRQRPKRPAEFTMYDSVDLVQVPRDAAAVAGYVGGHYHTYPLLAAWFKQSKHLSIAVSAKEDAECLDVENGDATIGQAFTWFSRQRHRGVQRPVLYCSLALARALTDELARHGVKRSGYRLWTAHYTGTPHRCSAACGFGFTGTADATQYTDKALGRNLDASLCSPTFL